MKKYLSILSVLLIITLLCSVSAAAEAIPKDEPEAVILELNDLESADMPDDYVVIEDGETILEVEHVKALGVTTALSDTAENGYFTAEFLMPDGHTNVFLTGLTRDNVSEIEQAIKSGYQSGKNFELKDLGFIDAEKNNLDDDDDNLCWAAATANTLTYTGWAAQAGFTDTDDLFKLYVDSFVNEGSHAYYGYAWFFNGLKPNSNSSAMPLNYPNSGKYLPQYNFDEFTESVDLITEGTSGVNTLYRRLRDGYGVVLNVHLYKNGVDKGGHATTCWGFMTDNNYANTDKAFYKSVIITDSDSDKYFTDGHDAPDTMHLYTLTSEVQGDIDTYSFTYEDGHLAVFYDSATLKPYRTDAPKETDANATMDLRTSPDLRVHIFNLSTAAGVTETRTKFITGSDIYYQPLFINSGEADYNGEFVINVKVVNRDNDKIVYSRSLYSGNKLRTIQQNQYTGFSAIKIPVPMAAGDYTITASVNDNRTVSEAYLYNNAQSINFRIRDSFTYTIGDTDGDGIISVIDATFIQRLLANINCDLPEGFEKRGDADGSGSLDISDATVIQRYDIHLNVEAPIGETGTYD